MTESFESFSFFRGVSKKYSLESPHVIRPRSDRRPRNSSLEFHRFADKWFDTRFGVAYRSQSLLVTSSLKMASGYGETASHVMRILPLSEYRFCWSPNISDLLYAGTSLKTVTADAVNRILDDANYRECDLGKAHSSGHEVMLFCEKCIAIPIELLGLQIADLTPGIILPG